MSVTSPAVTVLMAVYNGERYLQDTIDSVLSQDFDDFEFLVIDDGSTDSTGTILDRINDPRLRLIENEQNIGLTPSLNRGLRAAAGKYIARVDADDICDPQRLSRQVRFLEANQDYVICGSSYTLIDERGKPIRRKIKDFDDFKIRWISQFRTPIDHSTAVFRADSTLQQGLFYDETYRAAQDYDYWLRVLDKGKGKVFAAPLMQYRMHDDNITRSLGSSQKTNLFKIAAAKFRRDWPQLSTLTPAFESFLRMYHLNQPADADSVRETINAVRTLQNAFFDALDSTPEQRKWVRRQTSGILAEAILRNGRAASKPQLLVRFLYHARAYVLPLLSRYLEDRRQARLVRTVS